MWLVGRGLLLQARSQEAGRPLQGGALVAQLGQALGGLLPLPATKHIPAGGRVGGHRAHSQLWAPCPAAGELGVLAAGGLGRPGCWGLGPTEAQLSAHCHSGQNSGPELVKRKKEVVLNRDLGPRG